MITADQAASDPRWWLAPWWEEAGYRSEYKLSLEQIRTAIDAMRELFNEGWTQKALCGPFPNAVLAILYGGQGLMPFENLMWLGRIALAVSRISSVHSRLGELRGQKTRSTLFELEVASWMVESGWDVEFIKPVKETKTPDMRVTKGELRSWIECKRFESEQWEKWVTDLTHEVIRSVHECGNAQLPSFDVVFEARLSDLTWQDKLIRRGILEEIAVRISDGIALAFSTTPARSVQIPGIAEIRVCDDRPTTQRGFGGIRISPQAKMRRITQNGILEAAQQLSEGTGAVVLSSDFTPPPELVDVVLGGVRRADSRLLRNVGVAVISGSLGAAPVIWQNPESLGDPACQALGASFGEALTNAGRTLLPL